MKNYNKTKKKNSFEIYLRKNLCQNSGFIALHLIYLELEPAKQYNAFKLNYSTTLTAGYS